MNKNTPTHKNEIFIAAMIRAYRGWRGMSRRELGAAIGVSARQIYRYEYAKSALSVARLHAIAAALDVDIDYFFPKSVKY